MRVLLDTNILLRAGNHGDTDHPGIAADLRRRSATGLRFVIAPQTIYESWVVLTRPLNVNGHGKTPGEAARIIRAMLASGAVLPDPPDLLPRWLDLCTTRNVSGRPAHDARLVAWMLAHEVAQLLTLNPADFARYPEIHAVTPA